MKKVKRNTSCFDENKSLAYFFYHFNAVVVFELVASARVHTASTEKSIKTRHNNNSYVFLCIEHGILLTFINTFDCVRVCVSLHGAKEALQTETRKNDHNVYDSDSDTEADFDQLDRCISVFVCRTIKPKTVNEENCHGKLNLKCHRIDTS